MIKIFLSLWLLFIGHLGCFALASDGPELRALPQNEGVHWEKDSEIDGYTTYKSVGAKTEILPLKVEGILNAPIDSIMEHLRQVDGSENWTPDLIKKVTLKDVDPRTAITYSLTDMPWPVYDRKLVLHNQLYLDKNRKLLFILSKSVPFENSPAPKRTIEAYVGYANMGFRPIDRDRTYVELTAFIDPKGSLPAWLINFYQKSWPSKFLKALEARCQTHPVKLRKGLRPMLRDLLKLMKWDINYFDSVIEK